MNAVRVTTWALLSALWAGMVSFAQENRAPSSPPLFSRHVEAVFSRVGCNSGTCHGGVQGKNGFRLSLFGAKGKFDWEQVARDQAGRRINVLSPDQSLLLAKGSGQIPHGGGRLISPGSREYEVLRGWLATGAKLDEVEASRIKKLSVTPGEKLLVPGEGYQLQVEALFADGSKEDVTGLCGYKSHDERTATVDKQGLVKAVGIGDVAIAVRFRDEPVMVMALVARPGEEVVETPGSDAPRTPENFIDEQILAKLRRLKIPAAGLADDATFLRRARLDVTGLLPTPDEVREFLADARPDKRQIKIDELLQGTGYADLWTLKFCDLLKAHDYGVYADDLGEQNEAPRFQAWIKARLRENTPYDELAARILLATSRDGRTLDNWASEVIALQEGNRLPRQDLALYAQRQTLDIYWQRKEAVGVPGAMQVAHAFLGLRLECAQCHRHPHDVWQQEDLLGLANFFMRVRRVGFEGENEKRYPEQGALFKKFSDEGKKLAEEAKKLKEGTGKQLAEGAKKSQQDANRLKNEIQRDEQQASQQEQQAQDRRKQAAPLAADKKEEFERLQKEAAGLEEKAKVLRETIAAKKTELMPHEKTIAENDALQKQIQDLERRGRMFGEEVAKRILHAEIFIRTDEQATKNFASVTSPLGTQSFQQYRLPGQPEPVTIGPGEDPRQKVVEWMRKPDNPFFARAIVSRVWTHYFGRGLIDPPDDLSPHNPVSHPALLDELCRRFIASGYDLKWLHRTILSSRTYQQSSQAGRFNEMDRTNFAYFYYRRLPAEVLLDSLDQATGTREDMDMKYYQWPSGLRAAEIPYLPRNEFVTFVLEQFGRSERNSAVQCDCQRQSEPSMLQVLSLANHPHVRQKIADQSGRIARLIKETADPGQRIEELYLSTLSRLPEETEKQTCLSHVNAAESPQKGLEAVLWSLLNTREFILQH
ncbi:MAG: DUF1553 domain-containing protein [Planctomycetales bacterium]|nr:DUF1553 domain-containing protein [Planctomycetales bacterium]